MPPERVVLSMYQAKFKDLWTNPKGGANIIVFLR